MPTVLVARVAVSMRALDTNSTCAKNVRRNEEIYGKRYQTESAGAYFQTGKPAQGTDASGIFTAGADDRAGTAADFDVPFVLTDRMGNTVTKPFHFLASRLLSLIRLAWELSIILI